MSSYEEEPVDPPPAEMAGQEPAPRQSTHLLKKPMADPACPRCHGSWGDTALPFCDCVTVSDEYLRAVGGGTRERERALRREYDAQKDRFEERLRMAVTEYERSNDELGKTAVTLLRKEKQHVRTERWLAVALVAALLALAVSLAV